MNSLSADTPLLAQVDENYGIYTMKELFELHNQGRKIKVPALLNERGEKTWVEVEDVVSYGKQSLKHITLASSRLYAEISQDTIIPAYSDRLFSGTEEKINLKFKFANGLKVTQDMGYNDTLLLATHIPLNLPEGNQGEWEIGFALGFFVAEGSFIYRKHKNTKQSLAKLTALARKKGMALQEYLEYMTDVVKVRLSVGQVDFERGYVDVVQKHFKFTAPYKDKRANAYDLHSSDLSLIHLIKDYIDGSDSHTKHLKNEAYNRSWKFLEGILDGFLCGDGSYSKKMDLFTLGITTNYKLRDDLIFLSKALGYDVHLHNGYFAKSPSTNKVYYYLRLNIFKTYHRRTAFSLVKEHIRSVEDVGEREAYNLVVKPLYSENDKRSVFNHLFFTAFGFLASDAVKVLDRRTLKTPLALPFLQK